MALVRILPLDIRRLVLFHLPLSFSYSPIECCDQYFALLAVSPADSVVWKFFFKKDFGDEVLGVTDYKQEYINVLRKSDGDRLSYARVYGLNKLFTNALLLLSVRTNNVERLKYALSDPDADINIRDSIGDTLLYTAVLKNEIELVKILVNAGIDVNCKNRDGKTALHVAFRYGETTEISGYLIEHGADIHIADNGGRTFALIKAATYLSPSSF